MKVKVIRQTNGDSDSEHLLIDDKHILTVRALCECPEDAIIGRDLVDCCQVADFMKMAYEAAKKGEEITFEVDEDNNYDW